MRWADERAQALVDLLGERGLTISLSASRVLVVERANRSVSRPGSANAWLGST